MTQQLKRSPAGFYDASNYFMRHFDGPCGLWSSACSVGHSYMPDSPEITLARATEPQAVSRAMFISERARLRSLTAVDLEIFDSGFYPIKFPVSEVRSSFYDEADYCLDATGWIPTGSYCTRPSLYQDFLNVFAETLRDVS